MIGGLNDRSHPPLAAPAPSYAPPPMRRASWIASCLLHATAVGVGAAAIYGGASDQRPPAPLVTVLPSASASPPESPAHVVEVHIEERVIAEPLDDRGLPVEAFAPVEGTDPPAADPAFRDPRSWWLRVDPAARVMARRPPADAEEVEVAVVEPVAPDPIPAPTTAPEAAFVPPTADADNPPPVYPGRSRRLGHHGVAVVEAAVDRSGAVLAVALVDSSGYPELNREALRAVRGWRFQPARRHGAAVAATVEVEVEFRLVDQRNPSTLLPGS